LFLTSLKTTPSILLERKLQFKRLIWPEVVEVIKNLRTGKGYNLCKAFNEEMPRLSEYNEKIPVARTEIFSWLRMLNEIRTFFSENFTP